MLLCFHDMLTLCFASICSFGIPGRWRVLGTGGWGDSFKHWGGPVVVQKVTEFMVNLGCWPFCGAFYEIGDMAKYEKSTLSVHFMLFWYILIFCESFWTFRPFFFGTFFNIGTVAGESHVWPSRWWRFHSEATARPGASPGESDWSGCFSWYLSCHMSVSCFFRRSWVMQHPFFRSFWTQDFLLRMVNCELQDTSCELIVWNVGSKQPLLCRIPSMFELYSLSCRSFGPTSSIPHLYPFVWMVFWCFLFVWKPCFSMCFFQFSCIQSVFTLFRSSHRRLHWFHHCSLLYAAGGIVTRGVAVKRDS